MRYRHRETFFLIGIRLLPRAGTATLIICGHSLLGLAISSGVNPLWWLAQRI